MLLNFKCLYKYWWIQLSGFAGPILFKGTEYTSYETLRDAFLAGNVSENELKEQLSDIVNFLLTPVRNAFDQNETLKELQ